MTHPIVWAPPCGANNIDDADYVEDDMHSWSLECPIAPKQDWNNFRNIDGNVSDGNVSDSKISNGKLSVEEYDGGYVGSHVGSFVGSKSFVFGNCCACPWKMNVNANNENNKICEFISNNQQ